MPCDSTLQIPLSAPRKSPVNTGLFHVFETLLVSLWYHSCFAVRFNVQQVVYTSIVTISQTVNVCALLLLSHLRSRVQVYIRLKERTIQYLVAVYRIFLTFLDSSVNNLRLLRSPSCYGLKLYRPATSLPRLWVRNTVLAVWANCFLLRKRPHFLLASP